MDFDIVLGALLHGHSNGQRLGANGANERDEDEVASREVRKAGNKPGCRQLKSWELSLLCNLT